MDVVTTIKRLQSSSILDNVYAKSVILEAGLSSAEIQAAVGNNYGKLQFAFINIWIILKKLADNKKCLLNPNTATVTDILSKPSSSKLMSIVLFVVLVK